MVAKYGFDKPSSFLIDFEFFVFFSSSLEFFSKFPHQQTRRHQSTIDATSAGDEIMRSKLQAHRLQMYEKFSRLPTKSHKR